MNGRVTAPYIGRFGRHRPVGPTTDSPSTNDSGHRVGPELAMIMVNQTAIMSQLAEMEQRNAPLPAPKGSTAGPVEQGIIPAGPSEMELDDLGHVRVGDKNTKRAELRLKDLERIKRIWVVEFESYGPIFSARCQVRYGKDHLHRIILDVTSLYGVVELDEPSQ